MLAGAISTNISSASPIKTLAIIAEKERAGLTVCLLNS